MEPTRRQQELIWQLARYGVNGAIVTSLYTAVFVGLDSFTHAALQLCNMGGFAAAVGVGYQLHSRVTFRDHGGRGRGSQLRFLAVSVPSLFLNGFWAWLLGTWAQLPHWTVQLPIWFVTPLLTFAVQRWWVFR